MNSRILISEDERLVALDLQELLEGEGFEVAVAFSGREAEEKAKVFRPQLLICDVNLGEGRNGIETALAIRSLVPPPEVIFITAFSDEELVQRAELVKPFNYLLKPYNDEQVKLTVKRAFQKIASDASDPRLQELSPSELRILELIAEEKTSKEIAARLFIAEKTVRNHRYNIIKKLELPNDKNSLLKWAIRNLKK